MIFSYGITYGIEQYAGFEIAFLPLLFLAAAVEGVFFLVRTAREKKIHLLPFAVGLLGAGLVWYLWKRPELSYFSDMIVYFREWKLEGTLNLKYGWPLICAMLTVGEVLYHKIAKDIRAKLVISLGLIGVLIWQALVGMKWDMLPVASLLYISLSGITEAYQRMVQKREGISSRDILPFLAGVVILSSVLPSGSDPISWKPVENFFDEVGEHAGELLGSLANWGSEKEFEVGSVGFSDESTNFWGKLSRQNEREIMRISASGSGSTQNRYFTGRIKEIYENNSWKERQDITKDMEPEYKLAMQERLYYLRKSGIPASETEQFCRINRYKIQYRALETDTLFYPQNVYQILRYGTTAKYDNTGVNIHFPDKLGKDSIYQVAGLQMNLEQEDLQKYLHHTFSQKKKVEKTIFNECTEALGLTQEEITEIADEKWAAVLEKREQDIEKSCLQIPKGLTSQISMLAQEITGEAQSSYAKAQAVLSYLKEDGGYEYTLSPEELPEGRDPVDYFLFESKKGYCTHFASAAVLLCRAAGVPARYVEGIAADYEEKEEDGWYSISSSRAHSWLQVYLPEFGWIELDAAPGYDTVSGSWDIATGREQNPYENLELPGQSAEAGKETPADKPSNLETMGNWIPEAGLAIVLAAAVILLVLAAGKMISLFRYQRMENDKKAEAGMEKLFYWLKRRGEGIEKEETLRMYALRIGGNKEGQGECADTILWYEGVRYGNKEVTAEAILRLEELCRQEKKKTKKVKRGQIKIAVRRKR